MTGLTIRGSPPYNQSSAFSTEYPAELLANCRDFGKKNAGKWYLKRERFSAEFTDKQMHQNVFTVDGKQSVLHLEHQMCHFILG